jgi:peptide/nickel transport system permease protein
MSTDDNSPRFESVDWENVSRSRQILSAERVTLLVGLLFVGALYFYNSRIAKVYLVADWRVELLDWVFLVCLSVVLAYGAVPMLKNRESVSETLGRLRSSPTSLLALGYLGVFGFLGLFGSVLNLGPTHNFRYDHNPPFGISIKRHQDSFQLYRECAGKVTGSGFDEVCHGSMKFILGTTRRGEAIERVLVAGARPALYVVVIGAVLVVPIAVSVGLIAGLRGGFVDKLLMSYVDLQLSLPAILIYFVVFMTHGPSLLVLLFAFGLLSWGGIARLVRSEVKQRRERGHVVVARSLGAPESYIAKRHIVPNITNTLVPAICQLLALFILYEAGVAFIGFYEAQLRSWGTIISQSITAEVAGQMHDRTPLPAAKIWWVSTFPAIALMLTMASFKLLGDGLRDALDPRGEHR